MPARTVVVGRMSKWDGRQKRTLIPNEFQQMAGRAGRRGMDVFGHVVILYSPWIPFREMLDVAIGPLLPVQSAFAIRYNTVLNLWDPPQGERVRQMLQRSLAQYQASQRIRLIEHDILEVESDLQAVPAGCLIGYPDGDELLDDYSTRSRVMQSLQTQERRARKELRDAEQATSTASPWPRPTRQAIRRTFRVARTGLGCTIGARLARLLGRCHDAGVASRCAATMRPYPDWRIREIDFLTDASRPSPIAPRAATVGDARAALGEIVAPALVAELAAARCRISTSSPEEHREGGVGAPPRELNALEQGITKPGRARSGPDRARGAPCHTAGAQEHGRNPARPDAWKARARQ